METQLSLSLKGHSLPQFLANVRCGQTAGLTKMPLDMEVGLGAGGFVFDVDPAPPENRAQAPTQFLADVYILWLNGWMDQDDTLVLR